MEGFRLVVEEKKNVFSSFSLYSRGASLSFFRLSIFLCSLSLSLFLSLYPLEMNRFALVDQFNVNEKKVNNKFFRPNERL